MQTAVSLQMWCFHTGLYCQRFWIKLVTGIMSSWYFVLTCIKLFILFNVTFLCRSALSTLGLVTVGTGYWPHDIMMLGVNALGVIGIQGPHVLKNLAKVILKIFSTIPNVWVIFITQHFYCYGLYVYPLIWTTNL